MIAMQTLLTERQAAVALLAQFELYLRPDQAYRVRAIDLVRPVAGHEAHCFYTVFLSPTGLGQPTKTKEFGNVVPLDLALRAELGLARDRELTVLLKANWREAELEKEKQHAAGLLVMFASLVDMTATDFNKMLRVTVSKLKVELGAAHAYRLRYGGASRDYARGLRKVHEVKRRVFWQSERSVCRYERGSRVPQMLNALPDIWQAHGRQCAKLVYEVLAGKRLALAAPS